MTAYRTSPQRSPEPQTDKFMQMPKACISCVHYEPIGFDDDEHCPFERRPYGLDKNPGRTPFGSCNIHMAEVFATEICGSYECEPHVMPTEVRNRPDPRSPMQEKINFVDNGGPQ